MTAHSRLWKQFTHNTIFRRVMHTNRGEGRREGREERETGGEKGG